jgi:hypothetical protein
MTDPHEWKERDLEDYSKDPSVLFEVGSGELTALGVFAHESVMDGHPGPLVFPTMDKTRVILAFNERIFRDKVEILARRFIQERPDIDPEAIRRQSEKSLIEVMGKAVEQVLDDYFIVTEVHLLADPMDDHVPGTDEAEV